MLCGRPHQSSTFGASILLCLAYFLDSRFYKKAINLNIVYYFIACSVAGCILVAAPGNYTRLNYISAGKHTNLFDNIMNLINQIVSSSIDMTILIILAFIFLILIFSNKNVPKLRASIYSSALICSIFVLTPIAKSYDLNQRVLLIYYALFFIVTL